MNLNWIASTTLSMLRMAQAVSPRFHSASGAIADESPPGGMNAELAAAMRSPMLDMHQRLLAESIRPDEFWDSLFQDTLAECNDGPLTAATVEIAVIRAGGSQLQSDQTARILHRHFQTCQQAVNEKFPRQAEQLALRFAPLKQNFQAYGPGLIRSIGHRIWNAAPPNDWWPREVAIHAVQPIERGAGGTSGVDPAVWIEAVLTDVVPIVPEWLRLVYLLTCVAIDEHTRTHLTASTPVEAIAAAAGLSPAPTGGRELPWRLGTIPLVLDQASQQGVVPIESNELPIESALSLWSPESAAASKATWLETWWREIGQHAGALPPALKQLSVMLSS